MKRFFAIVLVFSLASVVNANLVLTIDGQIPAPSEITINVSDTINIGLFLTAGHTCHSCNLAFTLSNQQAVFDWSSITFPPVFSEMSAWISEANPTYVEIDSPIDFIENPYAIGPATIVDNLLLHCEAAAPVTLNLVTIVVSIDYQLIPPGTILDSVLIQQVPEPATMLLLGLGGLFLRHRR